ncbi:hypothetical protein [Agaribacterium haliotis]|uniref:hypothetical protein n=1 Tax=Agaribacterium haliotis TaxID=2013869 RepID=UPI0011774699|nr:hypothetical protein [Agaribacterium haliotis]
MKIVRYLIAPVVIAAITACTDSGVTSTSRFDREYGALIAQGIQETVDTEKDGMFLSWVALTKAQTGLELGEYAVQCTAHLMAYAGGDVPENVKAMMIEYKKDSDVFKNAEQVDQLGAIQISDLVEGKILHCLRAGSLDCCSSQS